MLALFVECVVYYTYAGIAGELAPVAAVETIRQKFHVYTGAVAMKQAKFSIGQRIYHQIFDYRGVVVDVDPEFSGTDGQSAGGSLSGFSGNRRRRGVGRRNH